MIADTVSQLRSDISKAMGRLAAYAERIACRASNSRLLTRSTILLIDSKEQKINYSRLKPRVLQAEANKCHFRFLYRVVSANESEPEHEPDLSSWPELHYSGINIYEAILYSICADMLIGPFEVDPKNEVHRQCITKWFRKAIGCYWEIKRLVAKHKPSHIITLHGYFIDARLSAAIAAEHGIKISTIDTSIAPGKLILSSLSGVGSTCLESHLWYERYRLLQYTPNDIDKISENHKILEISKIKDHSSPSTVFNWPNGSASKILFLGQVMTDAKVIFGSNDGVTLIRLVSTLIDYAMASGSHVMLKLHPKEIDGMSPFGQPYNKLSFSRIAKWVHDSNDKLKRYLTIDHSNTFSTTQLTQSSDVVITINSHAGLEALLAFKEVVLMGTAYYGSIGCTWNPPTLDALKHTLDDILARGMKKVDRIRIAAFYKAYFEDYLVDASESAVIDSIINRRSVSFSRG